MAVTYETVVSWPGEGCMPLAEAFSRLRAIWKTEDRISMSLLAGGTTRDGETYPPSIIEAWPEPSPR